MSINIAIDGPAGAGKSTVAKIISKEKGFVYVDTGSLYRAIAVYVTENNIDYNDSNAVIESLSNLQVSLKYVNNEQKVILNNEDVTGRLRTETISKVSSIVSAIPLVRSKLLEIQRKIASEENVVMDGRDIASVVLPNANLKIYLDAAVEERTKRRFLELKEKGENPDIEEIKKDIIERDHKDMTREISPLIKAEDAIYLDVSNMSAIEAANKIINLIK